jgi:hypothetical protein
LQQVNNKHNHQLYKEKPLQLQLNDIKPEPFETVEPTTIITHDKGHKFGQQRYMDMKGRRWSILLKAAAQATPIIGKHCNDCNEATRTNGSYKYKVRNKSRCHYIKGWVQAGFEGAQDEEQFTRRENEFCHRVPFLPF